MIEGINRCSESGTETDTQHPASVTAEVKGMKRVVIMCAAVGGKVQLQL